MRSRSFFVDHDDTGAPQEWVDPVTRSLRAAILASVPMMTVAPTFAMFLAGEGVASSPLVAGIVAIAIGQLVAVLVARWGRRQYALYRAEDGSLTLFSLAPVLLDAPVGSDDLGFAYQLWIAGCTAASMAIAGASRSMFVATSAVPLVVNAVLVAAGLSGVPRSFAVIVVLYLVVLSVSQNAQQRAVEQALANGERAHQLLDELRVANASLLYEASHDMLTGIAASYAYVRELV